MKILILSFYYEPDLSAGSFRTTALVNHLKKKPNTSLEIISTLPNRYSTFSVNADSHEETENIKIHRISLPSHKSGMFDQIKGFYKYYCETHRLVKGKDYDLVYATSGRLFTAFLGARISSKLQCPLYLDIRDIFVDTIQDVLPKKLSLIAYPLLSFVEKYTFNCATKINLVSKGFEGYFKAKYPKKKYSWFTNGIDDEFMISKPYERNISNITKVLYAGNIGEGQGLHNIIPELSQKLDGIAHFKIIGDGGRKLQLDEKVKNISNVTLCSPVDRGALIEEYMKADVLFLHLNDYSAFEKVLPSKLFEYGAMPKPVLAGVAGYAEKFIKEEISNSAVFYPGDSDSAVRCFKNLKMTSENRTDFIKKYSRKGIMKVMADDVISVCKK